MYCELLTCICRKSPQMIIEIFVSKVVGPEAFKPPCGITSIRLYLMVDVGFTGNKARVYPAKQNISDCCSSFGCRFDISNYQLCLRHIDM